MYVKIDKESIEVVIMTSTLKIVGTIYTLPQERLSDFMGESNVNNLPVTNASIYNLADGTFIARTRFLSLNRDDVTVVFPSSEMLEE